MTLKTESQISIQADDIKMRTEDKKFLRLQGNVKVSSDDFSARCDSMTAMAAPEADGKTKIVKIEGSAREGGNPQRHGKIKGT
ncbi:MAG: hypothetical protein ACLUKN_11210 [Bacilli bacterium]